MWTKKHAHVQTVHLIVWMWHKWASLFLKRFRVGVMICKGVFGTQHPKMKVLLPAETQEFKRPWTLAELSTFFICKFTAPKVWAQRNDTVCKTRVVSATWNWKLLYRPRGFCNGDLREEYIFHLKTSFPMCGCSLYLLHIAAQEWLLN